jgi:hydroxyacylglutathione hydrolase
MTARRRSSSTRSATSTVCSQHIEDLGLDVTHVLETHVHNDYVTGGFELARRTGATYVLNAADELFFDAHGVVDGDRLSVGTLDVRVMHTPGTRRRTCPTS